MRRDLAFSCALVFLSGAAALVYEVAWARWLMLALGAGAQSLAVTVAGTMLGLAAGNELGGRLADRASRRLRLYGLVELAVGAVALGASALLRAATSVDALAAMPYALTGACLLLVIAAPFLLMGATLPILVAYIGDTPETLRNGLGRLYAANTAGAVLGTLGAGFYLVEHLGLSGSAQFAACINAAVGLTAVLFGRSSDRSPRQAEAASASPQAPAAIAGAAVSGFVVMAHEVIDTRFLVHGFHATTHAFAIILASFIGGLALGAHLCAGRLRASKALVGELGAALLAGAALCLAVAPALGESSVVAFMRGRAPPWSLKLASEALVSGLLLLPSAAVMGFAFPLAAAAYVCAARAGASTGRVFLVNTLCGAAGSLVAGFLWLPSLGLRGALALTVAVQAAAGAALVAREKSWLDSQRRKAWALGAALLLAGAAWARPAQESAIPGQGTLVPQHLLGHEQDYKVLCYREGRLATTEVVQNLRTGDRTLFIDGFVTAGESPTSGYMALMGRLPMLLNPAPKRALVICLGGGATARAVAEWPKAEVDIVDINPDVFACAPSFGPALSAVLARARSFVEDGRRYLRREPSLYDVITQEPMPPYFAGTAALYSVEYYRLARRRLNKEGILAQWLPLHLVAPRDARQIVASALEVFPETWVAVSPGAESGLVVCSPRPLDPKRIALAESALKTKFILDPASARRYAGTLPAVTDDRPTLEYWGVDRVRGLFGIPELLLANNIAEMRQAALDQAPP